MSENHERDWLEPSEFDKEERAALAKAAGLPVEELDKMSFYEFRQFFARRREEIMARARARCDVTERLADECEQLHGRRPETVKFNDLEWPGIPSKPE